MRNFSLIFVFSAIFCFFSACVQDTTTASLPVRYTIIVTDKSEIPLDSVKIQLTDENLDEYSFYTGKDGHAIAPTVESLVNQISASKTGYLSKDSVDYITKPSDSSGVKLILRVVRFRLDSLVKDTTTQSL